jgi:Spy/CpxP family protein refolding chaperone
MKLAGNILAAFIFALAAQAGFAQSGPPSPPDPASMAQHQVNFLDTLLTLNAAQQQQALTIFTTAASSEASLRDQDRTAHQALDAAVKANDSAAISQAATAIGSLATQRTEAHAKADAALYQVLTPAQQNKLTQFKAAGPGFGPGPGGPGGPGLRD